MSKKEQVTSAYFDLGERTGRSRAVTESFVEHAAFGVIAVAFAL